MREPRMKVVGKTDHGKLIVTSTQGVGWLASSDMESIAASYAACGRTEDADDLRAEIADALNR